ncbi:MAG TPA: hypothetical protein IAD26_01910 [Candidatus Limenecus avicola]|uniref:Uncharacterized protein n=1 Tax=Candidatus Limenecus avicola TaxID=2840847 RepID=A0A9D1SR95_9CLOT|nr:hypothetical protein [Candidatus Limenecus avicola]
MLKKIFILITLFFISNTGVLYASETDLQSIEAKIEKEQTIQSQINDIGSKLLNANKIDKRIVFVYDENAKESFLKIDPSVTSRQVVVYGSAYKFVQNDDELAGFLARGILTALKSYDGYFNGYLSALQIKAAPKKFEIVADKRAVDYMVNAGYDPIGLITFIQKSCPQKRFDKISNKNLASKRLAIIYEYIYTKYQYFLVNNKYFENEHYQNFLLNSQNNRRMLLEKIKTGSKEELKYE